MTIEKLKLQNAVRELRRYYHDHIAAEIESSDKTYAEIGATYGVSEQLVYQVARLRGLCRTAQKSNGEQVNPGKVSPDGGENGKR